MRLLSRLRSSVSPDTTGEEEKGAAMIETAMVLSLLLMLALGAFEVGMAMRDWLSVTQSTREGVRLAATAGNHVDADCLILEATAGALQSLKGGTTQEVWIYKSDTSGAVTASRQRFRPAQTGDAAALLRCSGGWFALQESWPHSSRDNRGSTRDWIGVRVIFEYDWITDFLLWTGTATWTDDAVMHMEPSVDF